ncbi:MAG: 4-hydroxy-tetrahydrodipicolinate reductase [Pseudomonadota bacterium]|nr:4-hydroxy-tetrahydrodipicolinate reductase [Pseudomonadota bacterium]
MNAAIRIGVAGAPGKMGRAVASVVAEREGAALTAQFGRPGAADQDLAGCDVIVDFTTGAASAALASRAAANGGPALVIGSTGFSPSDEEAVRAASAKVAIVKSGNFSIGVAILAGLVEQAAGKLDRKNWDIEIAEAHHRFKRDAPSGTALLLGRAAAKGRGKALNDVAGRGRDGVTGPRREGDIGFSVMRAGGIVGEHAVVFAAEDEILTLSHSARDRRLFARGAVVAAAWVVGREPGLYDMRDVLGLRD